MFLTDSTLSGLSGESQTALLFFFFFFFLCLSGILELFVSETSKEILWADGKL